MRSAAQLPASVVAAARACHRVLDERFGDRVLEVRIFGSHARGDADDDSDVDVAVVIAGLTEAERTEAIDLAFRAWKLDPSPRILSPLVWSEGELEDRVRSERRIAQDVPRRRRSGVTPPNRRDNAAREAALEARGVLSEGLRGA